MSHISPPTNPQEGDAYIIVQGAVTSWLGKENMVAAFQDGAWMFYPPKTSWSAYVASENAFRVIDGTGWVSIGSSSLPSDRLAINAEIDPNNTLLVRGDSTLLTSQSDDHRLTININSEADTASVVFQTDHTGHAEMGLTGSNNFAFKVSPDGINFTDALLIDRATGAVTMPHSSAGSGSENQVKLGANASKSGTQNVPTNTSTKITGWNFTDFEMDDSTFDNSVLNIGPNSGGRYFFGLTIVIKSTSASVAVRMMKNDNTMIGYAQANGSGALYASASLAATALLVPGDEVEFQVWHSHGSSAQIHNVSTMSLARL